MRVDASAVGPWDTALVALLARIFDACTARNLALDTAEVPRVARQILGMARQGAVLGGARPDEPEAERLGDQFAAWARGWAKVTAGAAGIGGARSVPHPEPLVDVIGLWTIHWTRSLGDKIDFFGATVISLVRTLLGRTRRLRPRQLLYFQQAGVETLPIVALMGFAIGAVLTLVISGQLQKVGATALVARIVSLAVLREMGSLMVGHRDRRAARVRDRRRARDHGRERRDGRPALHRCRPLRLPRGPPRARHGARRHAAGRLRERARAGRRPVHRRRVGGPARAGVHRPLARGDGLQALASRG